MKNQQTIQAIEEKFAQAIAPLENRTTRKEINFKDIEINDDKLYHRNVPFSDKAQTAILGALQVKKGFIKYADKLSDSDWDMVSKKLKDAQGERTVIGRFEQDALGKEVIQSIFEKNNNKPAGDPENYRFFVDSITDSLSKSDINYDLGGFNFNMQNRTFDISLLDRDQSIDIFKNGKDIWDGGHAFTFNTTGFVTSPFFERLVCANGMRSRQNLFSSSINQSRFNVTKISELIEKSILTGSSILNEAVIAQANHLSNNNISIYEFEQFRNLFISNNEDEKFAFEKVRNEYFNDTHFYKAYQTNIAEKSAKWKASADSGINAYKFFNMLTWLGSHPEVSALDDRQMRNLQLKSSNLFFKPNLDLEDIAQRVAVDYPIDELNFA